jgi:ATP-dependent DNA ligase
LGSRSLRLLFDRESFDASGFSHPNTRKSAANGEAMFRHACRLGLEHIVSKRVTSRYKSGQCDAWRKVKNPEYVRRSIGLPA